MPEDCILPDFDEQTGNHAVGIYAVLDRDGGDIIEIFNEAPEPVLRVLYVLLTHDPDRPGHTKQKETNAFWARMLKSQAQSRGITFVPCRCVTA